MAAERCAPRPYPVANFPLPITDVKVGFTGISCPHLAGHSAPEPSGQMPAYAKAREHAVEPGCAVCLLPLREVELLNGNRNAVLLGIEHNLADRVAYRGGNLSTAGIL